MFDALGDIARAIVAAAAVLAAVGSGLIVIWVMPLADQYVPNVGPWDEQALRNGLILLAVVVYLGGLGPIVPKHLQDLLPSGPLWSLVIAALIALTLLQYVALGGGQPLWSAEHVIVHVLELLGLQVSDVHAFTAFVRSHLAPRGRAPWAGDVSSPRFVISNGVLVLLALGTITWAGRVAAWLAEPVWTESE